MGPNAIRIRIRIALEPLAGGQHNSDPDPNCIDPLPVPPPQTKTALRASPPPPIIDIYIYIYIYIYICIVFVRRTALSFLCSLGHPPPCAAQSPGAPSPNPKCGAPPFPFLVQPRAPATLLAQLGAWHVPMFRPKARTCKADMNAYLINWCCRVIVMKFQQF